MCCVVAQKGLPAHPFNALILPILRGCLQITDRSNAVVPMWFSVACFGVRVSVMLYLMFVHYTFSSVWVAEWPPFGK